MKVSTASAIGVLLMAMPSIVSGQTLNREDSANSFSGFYAGPEAGLHEHHFYLEETAGQSTRGRYYRGWGVGGGAFVGFDHPVSSRIRLGAEAGVSVGGSSPEARFPDGSFYVAKPRYGVRATGKVGFLLTDRLMAYGTLGYGGHRYRVRTSGNIANAKEWGDSFTIGAGVEYRASDKVGVRLDFRHLDNQMSHWLIGIPIRF